MMDFSTISTPPPAPKTNPILEESRIRDILWDARDSKRPRTADALLDETNIFEEHLPQGIVETEEEVKEHWYVGSIDQGTTSTRFLIFDGHGDPVVCHQEELENQYPQSGYVFIFHPNLTLTNMHKPGGMNRTPGIFSSLWRTALKAL